MTHTSLIETTRTVVVVFCLGVLAFAFGCTINSWMSESPAARVFVLPADAGLHRIDAIPGQQDPLLARLSPGAAFTPEQAARLTVLGENVCDGFAAHVPAPVIRQALIDQQGLAPDQAEALLAAAYEAYCPQP